MFLRLGALGALAVFALACGGSNPSSTEVSPTEPAPSASATTTNACEPHASSADLTSPPSTFEADVAPVLATSCGFSSCHGSRGPSNHGVYLGASADVVKAGLLKPSQTLPSMNLVVPGDPAKSFVMHKLDDDLCTLAACANDACGRSMPSGNPLLPEATRDAIRRWIAQGAH